MLLVLAAVGAITVAVLLWRAFGMPAEDAEAGPQGLRGPRPPKPQRKVTAPDDDPEFLRSLDERNRKDGGDR